MDRIHFDLSDPDAVSFCPSCGSGYTARAARCTDCGENLISRSRAEAQMQEAVDASDIRATVPLCRLEDRLKASLLESGLEEAQVKFFVRELGVQPGLASRGLGGLFEFVVSEEDLDRAEQILSRLDELPLRVLQDGLEVAVPRLTRPPLHHNQRLVHQGGQQVEDLVFLDFFSRCDRLQRLQRPSAGEHRLPPEQRLLPVRQQVVAPVDGRFQRPVVTQRGALPALQQAEATRSPRR